jgi:tRNA-binding EMAP/Myf-like protein
VKPIHAVLLLLVVVGIGPVQVSSVTASQNTPPDSENKKVCVILNVVKPSAVRFKDSITLTQAVKEAGGVGPNLKSSQVRIYISRKLEDSNIRMFFVDLRAIEKGRAEDISLENNDIVLVTQKDAKKSVPITQLTQSDCAPCGCKLIAGMHGPLIIP